MKPELDTILDDCLVQLKAGVDVQTLLAEYPDQVDELAGLLQTASFVRSLPAPRAGSEAYLNGMQRMLEASAGQAATAAPEREAAQERTTHPVSFPEVLRYVERGLERIKIILLGKDLSTMKLALRLTLDILVIMLIGGAFAVRASASSLPGDPIYGVKRTWEQVRLTLTLDNQARQQLETKLMLEREHEIQNLMQLGRQETVEFSGILSEINGDRWTVGGLVFELAPDTAIEGSPQVGQTVHILVQVQEDGTLLALQASIENHHGGGEGEHHTNPAPSGIMTPMPSEQPMNTAYPTIQPMHTPAHTPIPTQGPMMTPGMDHPTEPSHTADPNHNDGSSDDWDGMPDHDNGQHEPGTDHQDDSSHDPGSDHSGESGGGGHH